MGAVHLVGKEGNRIDGVATGEVLDPDEVLTDYGDDAWENVVVPVARAMRIRRLHRATGLALSQISDLVHLRASPHPSTRARVKEALTMWAEGVGGLDRRA